MGDLQIWKPSPNGSSIEEQLFPLPLLSSSFSSSNPDPISIDAQCWLRAEQTTKDIICHIHPTVLSEQRRKAVIEYVQRLIRGYLGSEVCPYGSVPLKTYLPDGDIDLTALALQNVEDALANDIRSVLEGEEKNKEAEFEVKDVQYIHAEVKLVKCLVQNIVVDISVNQIGGLCTLCFLEQVDRLIGKDHLFKRSIILIKAWCYYESRILGAHHGLISTYALETLVLYIFHVFHSSLNGPLAVLYRFLDYYSKFDWDNYCITLNGPACVTSLPEIVAEMPAKGGGGLLLSKEFLRNCVDLYSVKGFEMNSRPFPQKHLNIVDPLKENNNLGRSVSKGNFYRIRSAFTYGARKLGRILLLPGESMTDELDKFFMNTLDRHGSGLRPDLQDLVPPGAYVSDHASSKLNSEKFTMYKTVTISPAVDRNGIVRESTDLHGLLSNGIKDIKIAGMERNPGIGSNEVQRYGKVGSSKAVLEMDGFANGVPVSGVRLVGDAKDRETLRTHGPSIKTRVTKSTSPSSESDSSPLGGFCDVPHLYSNSYSEKVKMGRGNLERTHPKNSGTVEKKMPYVLPRLYQERKDLVLRQRPDETNSGYSFYDHEGSIASGAKDDIPNSEDLHNGYREVDYAGIDGSPGASNSLSDLTGEYEINMKSLLYGQWCHEYGLGGSVTLPPPPPSQLRNKHGWDRVHRSMPLKRNTFSHLNTKGVSSGPRFYSTNSPIISGAAFGAEEMPKPRGTGTYFPNMNYSLYRDRSSFPMNGRNPALANHGHFPRSPRESGWVVIPHETKLLEKGSSSGIEQQQRHHLGPGPLDVFQNAGPVPRGRAHSNGFSLPETLEFGTFGRRLPLGSTPSPDVIRQPADVSRQPAEVSRQPVSSPAQTLVSTLAVQRPRPSLSIDTEKASVQAYHMKDDDFPPLSV